MSYVTTTDYGTWCTQVEPYSTSLEQTVAEALGDYVDDYDLDAIANDYSRAINEALPPHMALTGDQFIGPAYEKDQEFDGYPTDEDGNLDIKAVVEGIDFWEIAARHELWTAEDVGRDALQSKAANPAKVASSTMKRLGVKPHTYRPHPDSGRPQALYKRGEVEAALKNRPGQGARTDRASS